MRRNNERLKQKEGDFLDEEMNERIIRSLSKSKRRSLITNGMVTGAFILMILPICTMITFIYYGYGVAESRGNEFVKAIEGTIAITEPNVFVDNISHKVEVFSMTGYADVHKQIGSQTEFINEESYKLWFNHIGQQTRKRNINKDYFIHPNEERIINKPLANKRIQNLPEGTVSEIFISLNTFYSEQDVIELFSDLDIDLVWFAVNDGETVEENTLLGYPTLTGDIDSPFNKRKDNSEQFIDTLSFLAGYDDWFKAIARRNVNSLDIENTIDYINQNGIEIYGVAATGPTKEFIKINRMPEVRDYYIGAVELWEWK